MKVSEPEPDLALLAKHPTTYFDALPTANDVVLIIEVADTTFLYDTTNKMELYANAGIPDYWVVDIENVRIFTFSNLVDGAYQRSETYHAKEVVQFQELRFAVNDIIPQKRD